MKLSTKAISTIKESFSKDNSIIPDYFVDEFIDKEYEISDIHHFLVKEIQNITDMLQSDTIIHLGLCGILINEATRHLKRGVVESTAQLGQAAQEVVSVLQDDDNKEVAEKYVNASNCYYGLVFGSLHSGASPEAIGEVVGISLKRAADLRDEAYQQIKGYQEKGILTMNPMDLLNNTSPETRRDINKSMAQSVLITSVIGLLGAQLGKHLHDELKN